MKNQLFTLFLCLFSMVSIAQNEAEPNNNFGQAQLINLNTTINGQVNIAYDEDFFKFNVTESGVIELKVLFVPSDIDLDAKIYKPTQEQIRGANYSGGQTYSIEVSSCDIGEHFLLLSDGDNDFNSISQYSFRVEFTPFSTTDIHECSNETFSEAALIDFDTTIEATVAPYFDSSPQILDKDYYKFNTPEPGMIILNVLNVPSNIDLDGHIYKPTLEEIRTKNASSGESYIIEVSTCEIGEHFLLLSDGDDEFNSDEQYSFRMSFKPFSLMDNCECENESFSDACLIEIGETVEAVIAPWFDNDPLLTDKDYYKFNIQEPGIITLNVQNVPDNIDLDGHIYKPTLEEIRSKNASTGEDYIIEVSTCEIGEHYIFLNDGGSFDGGQSFNSDEIYNFSVIFQPFSTTDPCECNNSFEEACIITSCDTIQALINPWLDDDPSIDKDEDYYAINLIAGENIDITISSVPDNIGLCIEVLDDNQIPVASTSGSNGQAINFNFTASDDGLYYMVIEDCGNDYNSEEQYVMHLGCSIASGIEDLAVQDWVQISPNPFAFSLNIDCSNYAATIHEIRLMDVLGNEMYHTIPNGNKRLSIDASRFPNGMYLLYLKTQDKQYMTKVVKM